MKDEKDIFDFIQKQDTNTPDTSYFENLADSVLKDQNAVKGKIIPLYRKPSFWITSAAAILVGIIFITTLFERNVVTETSALAELNQFSSDELYAYVDENIDDFDVELIAEFIPEAKHLDIATEDLSPFIEDEPIESVSFDDITSEEILEYLEDEDIDLSDSESINSFI